ncbi:MAG: hypothetical protein JWR68_1766 [Polaromonas sp.]|nr:hypothetical protein [Polaromonas sp.]
MNSLIEPRAPYRTVRYHAALNAGHTLSVSGARQETVEVLLRQSDIDSSCSAHAFATALLILGVVKRNAVLQQAKRKHGVAAVLYRTLADSWFEGLHAKPFFDAIQSMTLPILPRLCDISKKVDAFAVNALLKGKLVLIAYTSERDGHSHWVLAVGVSGFQIGKTWEVDTLFVLCSSSEPVPLASHNARLNCAQPTDFGKKTASTVWQFESMPYSSEPVRLTSAIALEPSELHDNFDLHE